MRWPARTIWDTRIQCVCGIISARSAAGVEIYASGNFGQVSVSPARIAINPNRLYPIEKVIQGAGRFAINVMPESERELVARLTAIRRREPDKPEVVGLRMLEDAHRIPFTDRAMRTVFCEVEQVCDTGDHTLIIGRVLESRVFQPQAGQKPLLYQEIAGTPDQRSSLLKALRSILVKTGALDLAKQLVYKRRPPPAPNIAAETYEQGGQTEGEIVEICSHGLLDLGRPLKPPHVPHLPGKGAGLGVCVVGTGWGAFHCELIRKAAPSAKLFVCGRNPDRTQRLARAVGADDFFLDLDAALKDQRVQALSLALPHDVHREAVERVAAAGKHALVEKPIATSLADADAMIDAARKAGTILMVAEDMHFRPAIREAARRIALGDVGEPLYLLVNAGGIRRPQGWAADKTRMGGGVLMDIGVHYIRALRLLMGEPDSVIATRAMQVNTKTSGEDSAQVIFSSRAGWQAHMLFSWASTRGLAPDIIVAGDKGTFHLWPGAGYLDYYPANQDGSSDLLVQIMTRLLPGRLTESKSDQRRRIELSDQDRTGYESEMREFLSAVAEGRQPSSLPEDARRDLEIVLCSYEAMGRAHAVAIPGFRDSQQMAQEPTKVD